MSQTKPWKPARPRPDYKKRQSYTHFVKRLGEVSGEFIFDRKGRPIPLAATQKVKFETL